MMIISNYFRENNIKYLTHFSSIYNLESILNNGLLSVKYMNNNNIKFYNSDSNRFDNQLELISLSSNIINKKMLFKKNMFNKQNLNIWFVIIIDLEVLDDNSLKFYYCKTNAASCEMNSLLRNNINYLTTENSIKEYINSTSDQKEILVKGTILPKYFKGLVVKNNNDIDLVKKIVKSLNLDIPVICNKALFE